MRKIDNRKGLSLIEVIIAMAIFTIIAIIMLAVYSSVFTVVGNSRQQSIDNYSDQATVEENLAEGVTTGTTNIQFVFSYQAGTADDVTINVNGEVANEGEISAFIPAYD
jgi:prepilin-type N-terminal cleavage/methylation domain-containing protein